MKTVTVANLIAWIRQAADMVGSTFVDDTTEILPLINAYHAELRDLLIEGHGPAYFASSFTATTTSGTGYISLPTSPSTGHDLYQVLGVDVTLSSGDVISATPFDFHSRNAYASSSHWSRGEPIHYRIHGDKLLLLPTPDGAYTITVHYLPATPTLTLTTETVDGVNGWERYIVVCAAIVLLQKEESDISVLMAEKASLLSRIRGLAAHRDAAYPDRVVRTRARKWVMP
ncbi:MAG TPA: hypothetical protein PLI95_07140 [Polyangiaceae bacterium]|nr:hypothetical protein [Polyangiaceae bacterium]